MKTYYKVTCELYTEHVVPVLNAKQYDSGRGVDITLTDCGAVVVPAVSDVCNLYCKKSDGTVSYISGTVTGDAVRVDFTNTLLAAPGLVECELEVTSGADTVSTPVFKMVVLPSNYDQGAIQSQDEFTALETALQTVSSYDGRIDALEATAAGLGTASTYDVANNLTTASAGSKVLDAYQGKLLNDAVTALNTGYAKFGVHTFTGTTTSSGALSIPSAYSGNNAVIFGARYSDGTTGLVYQRDASYFTCMLQGTGSGTYVYPNANATVKITFGYWLQT